LTITFERDPRIGRDIDMIKRTFETSYLAQYGVNPSHVPIEIVSWRLTVRGPDIATGEANTLPREPGGPKAKRTLLLWPEAAAAVYDRAVLASGQTIAGPAIIEERETTIVIPPGWDATVNAIGCVVAQRRT
jgi:N-methylhydantoinase A